MEHWELGVGVVFSSFVYVKEVFLLSALNGIILGVLNEATVILNKMEFYGLPKIVK